MDRHGLDPTGLPDEDAEGDEIDRRVEQMGAIAKRCVNAGLVAGEPAA
ncbi:hypothetical protein AB5J49_09025 [Streptomyces sp. R28]|uniref:Uncharacterized protein n=1 Tax=Streptomyces sp. R28 TaxID=3238628 RepID=A0AB39PRT7_9ACTN